MDGVSLCGVKLLAYAANTTPSQPPRAGLLSPPGSPRFLWADWIILLNSIPNILECLALFQQFSKVKWLSEAYTTEPASWQWRLGPESPLSAARLCLPIVCQFCAGHCRVFHIEFRAHHLWVDMTVTMSEVKKPRLREAFRPNDT